MSIKRTLTALVLACSAASAQEKPKPVYYINPAWSPDGRRLAFESTRDGPFAIYVIGVDGTGLTKLSSGSAAEGQPSWSPDGTQLVFTSNRDGHEDLYI